MSEKIQVVAKLNKSGRGIRFEYQTGLPFFACLSDVLAQAGVAFSMCGGRGICGKCRIRFINGASLPTNEERKFLTAEELRQGIRLACMTKPSKNCEIEVLFEQEATVVTEFGVNVATAATGENVREDEWDLDSTDDIKPYNSEYVITADVGTTTIAMALVDVVSGKIVKTYTCMNPQSMYGSDVIARITAAGEVGADKLQQVVAGALIEGAKQLVEEVPVPKTIYVAANTVMNHFLAGSDASGLGAAPFTPEFLDGREVECEGYRFVLVPGVSAFVGGDIVAGMLSFKMEKGVLFLDLGTNGEMALSDGENIYCTSAAAGPAFEGNDSSKRGSHRVKLLADLLRSGDVDETGLLRDEGSDAQRALKKRDIGLSQKDIRDLQMAKAAVRTGIEVLLQKANLLVTDIKQVYLAGGFGYYIDVEDAIAIGLLPDGFKDKTLSVGNSSLRGAAIYAGLVQVGKAEEVELAIRKKCIAVNLAEEEGFIENYIEQMNFYVDL